MVNATKLLPSSAPIGSTQRALFLPEPDWVPMDGRVLSRGSYPTLQQLFPINKFVGISRTLATAPVVPQVRIHAGTSTLVSVGASGVAAIQYSTNLGVNWVSAVTPSIGLSAMLIAAGYVYGLNSAAAQGIVSNAAISGGAFPTFVATTGGPTSVAAGTSLSRLVYASNLTGGGSVGVVIAIPSASGNLIYYVAAGGTAYQSLTIGETAVKQAACWTNPNLFIVKSGTNQLCRVVLASSAPGVVTVTATMNYTLPETVATGQGNIASDGNGVIVITGVPSGMLVSYDNGLNFEALLITGVSPSDTWRVQHSEGYWFIPTAQGTLISTDAKVWQLEPHPVQAMSVATSVCRFATGYMQVGTTTTAYSTTEDTLKFNLPYVQAYSLGSSGSYIMQERTFIKAR
jgi:hypothetical protein